MHARLLVGLTSAIQSVVTASASRGTYTTMSESARRDRSKPAFERLYGRVARRVLIYLVRQMQDVDAATELWCECWAIAFEGWASCRARSVSEEDGWVFGIARHQLARYYRSGAIEHRALERLKWSIPTLDTAELDELERAAELDALRAIVGDALGRLPEKHRRAVELRVVAGCSYAEVAGRMECSEQAARANVSRGLRRLAGLLAREDLPRIQGASE
jgi:RNA polymerase sigma-70 factor (ECF subfamily)